MKKIIIILMLFLFETSLTAQNIKVNIGPELLSSFNHDPSFIGIGGSAQMDVWIKERLWLGLNSGYLNFTATKSLIGNNTKPSYSSIPVLGVIKYPLPIVSGLYGQDMFGYTFAQNVKFEDNNEKANGGFTYYFALGYEFAKNFDVSVKVGRSRFNKKDRPVNVNEHNVGIKVAYLFKKKP